MKNTVKWFRKIRTANRIFGLEFIDLFLLLAVFLLVFMFSANLVVNTAILLGAYFFLRLYKNNKPPHWTGSVAGFLVRPQSYPMRRETEKEIFE
ncbi:MAG: hypothetical protein BWY42_01759 [Candidatus Omnitrophica bacterium ADurb.Bin277]|nr:MAG: hypothetical protein BWY42_01759 [Candidatus Omnitrophica bacterium ADurb.Bin277]